MDIGKAYLTLLRASQGHCWLVGAAAAVIVGIVMAGFDASSLAPVGSSYWPLPKGYGLYAHSGPGVQTATFFAYLIFSALLGTLLLAGAIQVRATDLAFVVRWIPLAAFIPGYLTIIGINRLITFALPNVASAGILPLLYLAVALWLAAALRGSFNARNVALIGSGLLRLVAVFAVFLVFQVQTDNSAHVFGDGAKPFLDLISRGTGLGPTEFFPIFFQHYDEIMFLYPFIVPFGMADEVVELFWMLYAMGKASAFAALCVGMYLLIRRRSGAYLIAILLFFGGLSLSLGGSPLIFDAGSPLRVTLHPGRVLLAVLPIVAFCLAISGQMRVSTFSKAGLFGGAMLGIGYSSLTMSGLVLWASILLGLGILSLRISRRVAGLGAVGLIALLVFAYLQRGAYGGSWLFLGGIVAAFLGIGYWAEDKLRYQLRALARGAIVPAILAMAAGMSFGFLLLGNGFASDYVQLIGLDEVRCIVPGKSAPQFQIGFNPYCGRYPLSHCGNLYAFFSSFGMVLILALLASLAGLSGAGRKRTGLANPSAVPTPNQSPADETVGDPELAVLKAIACSVLFLVTGFFAYDFTNGDMPVYFGLGWLSVWFKSRLIEPWVYATIAFSSVLLWMESRNVIRAIVVFVLTWQAFVYSFVLADTPIHLQFLRNGMFLMRKVFNI